ncbi:1402_t:CDS:2, partial [Ambispora gerdemannii]
MSSEQIYSDKKMQNLWRESTGNQAQDLSQFYEITSRYGVMTPMSELEQDDEIDKNQIIEQDLIQELHLPTKENDSSIKISNSGDKSGNMSLEELIIVSFENSAQH